LAPIIGAAGVGIWATEGTENKRKSGTASALDNRRDILPLVLNKLNQRVLYAATQ